MRMSSREKTTFAATTCPSSVEQRTPLCWTRLCPLHCTCTDPQTTTPQTSARLQVMRSNLLQSAAISYTSPLNVCVSSKSNFRPLQQFPINYQLSITHCPIARFHPSSSAPSHCNQFQTFHSTAIVRHSPEKKQLTTVSLWKCSRTKRNVVCSP